MALTRHQLLKNSRRLRSGHLPARRTSKVSQSRRVRKPSPLLSKPSKNVIASGQHRQSNLSSTTLLQLGDEDDDIDQREENAEYTGSDSSRYEPNPPASTSSLCSLLTRHRSTMDTEEDTPNSTIQEQEGQDTTIDIEESFLPRLEGVGLPPGGVWDHDAAYDRRFCFDHGETECLLGTADRWMFPSDFDIPDAEAALEAMLQKHNDAPFEFEPHSRRYQAECWGTLYSHIHSVLDKEDDSGRVLYLVRWKACWTPESHVVDHDWIPASLEANENRNCRRSTRLRSSFADRKEKYEQMMVVVNLE